MGDRGNFVVRNEDLLTYVPSNWSQWSQWFLDQSQISYGELAVVLRRQQWPTHFQNDQQRIIRAMECLNAVPNSNQNTDLHALNFSSGTELERDPYPEIYPWSESPCSTLSVWYNKKLPLNMTILEELLVHIHKNALDDARLMRCQLPSFWQLIMSTLSDHSKAMVMADKHYEVFMVHHDVLGLWKLIQYIHLRDKCDPELREVRPKTQGDTRSIVEVTSNQFGAVLDIDGVLIHGSRLLPHTVEALQLLHHSKIPTVFVTNGGGVTEEQKADELSKIIGLPINPKHLVLSHTPFKQYVSQYETRPILVIGGDECLRVARSYGFKNAMTSSMLHHLQPEIHPLKPPQSVPLDHLSQESLSNPLEAAFIFAESCDWGLDIQILSDLLTTSPNFPIYACNPDLVYNSNHHLPRYTQGAFVHAFKSLHSHYQKQTVSIISCGKPNPIQYQYAENVLQEINQGELICGDRREPLRRFYGIGDNPASDIRGANQAGSNWKSILVKTGLYREGDELEIEETPHFTEDNVLQAVKRILNEELISPMQEEIDKHS
jgi:HAD superfamily hydrolase (TIGR01456 family)